MDYRLSLKAEAIKLLQDNTEESSKHASSWGFWAYSALSKQKKIDKMNFSKTKTCAHEASDWRKLFFLVMYFLFFPFFFWHWGLNPGSVPWARPQTPLPPALKKNFWKKYLLSCYIAQAGLEFMILLLLLVRVLWLQACARVNILKYLTNGTPLPE